MAKTKERPFSSYLSLTLFLGLLGVLGASWVAPKTIAWYFETPVSIGINCKPATEWSMGKLQMAQFIGLGLGIVFGMVASVFWARRQDISSEP